MRILTIVLLGATLIACGGGGGGSGDNRATGLPPPTGENSGVVQFMRDYYLTFEGVYAGRVPPSRLTAMYGLHCTENLRPGQLDVFVLATQLDRPGANAAQVMQVDIGEVTLEPIPDWPDYVNVTLPGERNLRFLVGDKWLSGEQFESLIRARTPLSSEPVTRELLRIDGKIYLSDCDFAKGLPARK